MAALLASLGCQPMETDDHRSAGLSRTLEGDGSYHVVVTLSRAAVDQTTTGLWVRATAFGQETDAAVSLVPDDAALDGQITSTEGEATLDVDDLAAMCPAEGECVIGLTVLVEGGSPIDTSIAASVSRPLDAGRFTADATLTIVQD